jgi:hypothetical protein
MSSATLSCPTMSSGTVSPSDYSNEYTSTSGSDNEPYDLEDFMVENKWVHARNTSTDFSKRIKFAWDVYSGAGGPIWQVRVHEPPQTLMHQANGWYNDPLPGGPGSRRHEYDLHTTRYFTDFHMRLEFRCPYMRNHFDTHADGLRGWANWGNSGIKILEMYEVQILDSHKVGDPNVPDTGWKMTLKRYNNTDINASLYEICGAIYRIKKPSGNPVKKAVNSNGYEGQLTGGGAIPDYEKDMATGDKKNEPCGDWNQMDIWFMAPRVTAGDTPTQLRAATISVLLNGTMVHDRVGIQPRGDMNFTHAKSNWGTISDTECYSSSDPAVYPIKLRGPITLQQHDNKVQFRNIKINSGWRPTSMSANTGTSGVGGTCQPTSFQSQTGTSATAYGMGAVNP